MEASSFTVLELCSIIIIMHTHTHAHLTALHPGLPRWASTRKVKPICILLKQETVSGSGISWAICKSAPRCRQITMPTPHHSVFFTVRMPFLLPNNSVKALKAKILLCTSAVLNVWWYCTLVGHVVCSLSVFIAVVQHLVSLFWACLAVWCRSWRLTSCTHCHTPLQRRLPCFRTRCTKTSSSCCAWTCCQSLLVPVSLTF